VIDDVILFCDKLLLFDFVLLYFWVFYGVLDLIMVFDGMLVNVVCGFFDMVVMLVMLL